MVPIMKFIFFNLSLLLSLLARAEIFEDKDLIEYSGRKYAPVFGFVVKRNSGQIMEKTFYKDGLKNGLTESFHSADQASAVGEFLMNEREVLGLGIDLMVPSREQVSTPKGYGKGSGIGMTRLEG